MGAIIVSVDHGSYAQRCGIQGGDVLLEANGHPIRDVFDYQFYTYDNRVSIGVERSGERLDFVVDKADGEYLGLNFETYLMDSQKSCGNKCIFCFVDQLPKGMRETLYFKDDDARLSFLMGNYISLTNLSTGDVDRIIKMRFSPLNISVHTTDSGLRDIMLGNKNGGKSLRHLYTFASAGLDIKAQIVVCPGVNDGQALKKTLRDLSALHPSVSSVAVVPVGLSRHRTGLHPLTPMGRDCARETLDIIEAQRELNTREHGNPLIHGADELFLKAELPIPPSQYYDEYEQIENGVGLMALFEEQVQGALGQVDSKENVALTIATGVDAAPFIKKMLDYVGAKWHNLNCKVVGIKNNFFGEHITVAGLVTGGDIIEQLKGKTHGGRLLLPECMLRHKENVFLDDVTVEQVAEALGVSVDICPIDGWDFVEILRK